MTEPAADPPVDGRATRWTGQQERRRAEFVEAALAAIEEHGPDTSTEQIAARAGVARTRLYRHFSGAQELNQVIAARAETMLLERLATAWDTTASPETIIRTAVSTHLQWMTEHHQLYAYLVRQSVTTPAGDTVVNDVRQIIATLLEALIGEWTTVLEIEVPFIRPLSSGLVGFVDAAAARWVAEPGTTSLEELVEVLSAALWAVVDSVLRGLGVTLDPTTPISAVAEGAEGAEG